MPWVSDNLGGPWPPPSVCWSSVMIHSLKNMEQLLNSCGFLSLPMLSIFFWYAPTKLPRTWSLRFEGIRCTAFLQDSLGLRCCFQWKHRLQCNCIVYFDPTAPPCQKAPQRCGLGIDTTSHRVSWLFPSSIILIHSLITLVAPVIVLDAAQTFRVYLEKVLHS